MNLNLSKFNGEMMYEKNFIHLKNQMGVNLTHIINKNSPMLPFVTREPERVKFKKGFNGIIGEFARLSSNKEWSEDISINNLINKILLKNENIKCSDENKKYLIKIIKDYIVNENNELNIFHPHLFLYLPLSDNSQKAGEKKIAEFINNVFFMDIDTKEFFDHMGSDQVMIKFILDNILELSEKYRDSKYIAVLPFICDVFKEDWLFVRQHENFLVNNLEYILAYYYFYYCSQFSLKLQQNYDIVNLNKPTEIYYLLDSEKASKSRKSINNGYNLIKKSNKDLLVNINIIEHLNILAGTQGLFPFQIYELLENDVNYNKEEYLKILNKWIQFYNNEKQLEAINSLMDFKSLEKTLFNSINQCIQQAPKSRYAKNLEEVAKKYFAKGRGQYGLILTLNKDMLYILTALCVKKDKIKLTDLFKEFEYRGIFFDRYSKNEVITILNNWNLIDKKSDSGDAQYVKSIL